jgi:LPS export ABC transporter protein LptC
VNKKVFILALVGFVVFQWFYYQTNKTYQDSKTVQIEEPVSQTETPEDKSLLQEQKVNNFYLIDGKKQAKDFELWSDVAHKGMGTAEWSLDKVKAQFYSENVVYVVTGDKGLVDDSKNSMVIDGNVKLNSSNGYFFYTDKMTYDPSLKKITSDSKVSLEGPKEKDGRLYLEGYGLFVDMNVNLMIMQDRVSGYKPMSDNRVMNISSQSAEFSGLKKSVSFKNNVVIKVNKMVVRGNLANFQYKDGKLDTLYMDGGIHLQDQDKTGTSGEAIVYFNEDKYIFRKKPFVTQGENELIGDEITIFNGGKLSAGRKKTGA